MAFAQCFLKEFRQQGLSICGRLPVCVGHSGHAQTGGLCAWPHVPLLSPQLAPRLRDLLGTCHGSLSIHLCFLQAEAASSHHLTQSGYIQSEHLYLGLTNVLAQAQSSSLEHLTGTLGTRFPSWLDRVLESCGFSAPGEDRA